MMFGMICVFDKEEFDIGNYQVCHYVFPECPSMEQIETAFSTTENVVSALELIFGNVLVHGVVGWELY